jgi:hypothetical protein
MGEPTFGLEFFTLENWMDIFVLNVGKKLPLLAAQ